MKKLFIVAIIAGLLLSVVPVQAKEMMLTGKITDAVTRLDKNGNEYVRLIIEENKTLDGVNYTVGTPVMCFGQTVAKAKAFSQGDMLKAIVNSRFYQGRKSYTLIAFPE